MTETTPYRQPDYAAAAAVVRDLFGGCLDPSMTGITLTINACGVCARCVRDWTPEAKAIVDAAQNPPSEET